MSGKTLWTDFDVIYVYSRAQAIEDGNLVDVSQLAKQYDFRFPLAMTRGVWEDCVAWTDADQAGYTMEQSEGIRLETLLQYAYMEIQRHKREDNEQALELSFAVCRLPRDPINSHEPLRQDLKINCGPGDNGEPVLTIMFPEED